jgi:hypothetical protein
MDGDDLDHSPMAQFTYDNRNFETKQNLHIAGVILAKISMPEARSVLRECSLTRNHIQFSWGRILRNASWLVRMSDRWARGQY